MHKTAVLTLGLLLSQLTWADAIQDISVNDPYARAVPPGQPNSAAFMVLENASDTAHAIVSASSPVAEVVELHTHVEVDGMMQMRPIEKIEIPADSKVELKPGGLHVMLIGLKQDLKVDDNITVTLNFADESSTELTLPVRKIAMKMKHHH
jgi:copper(I)-binding protein